jgi:hypothetical protein
MEPIFRVEHDEVLHSTMAGSYIPPPPPPTKKTFLGASTLAFLFHLNAEHCNYSTSIEGQALCLTNKDYISLKKIVRDQEPALNH